MRGKINIILLPLIAYGVYLGSGIVFFIFYPEIIENQWYQIISSWVGFGLSLFLIIGGIISFSTIFPIVKEPITLFRKIFNITIAIGYAFLLFWLAFTLGKIYEVPIQSPSPSTITSTDSYSSDELGFSFQYPDYLLVEEIPDLGLPHSHIIVYPKFIKANENEPMTAIIINESTDNPEMTAEVWLKGPNSGFKVSDGYGHRLVGGQDAVITNEEWVVVKTPDGKKRISIAYLVEQEKGAQPLHTELQQILDTFSFK